MARISSFEMAAGPGCKDKADSASINAKAVTGGAFEPLPGATVSASASAAAPSEPEFRVEAPSPSASAPPGCLRRAASPRPDR